MGLTVMSWNLSDLDVTASRDSRAQGILDHISAVKPDILCCQKLTSVASPSNAERDFDRLADRFGMVGRLGLARGTRLHVAVLWRPRIVEFGSWVALGDRAHRNAALANLWLSERHVVRMGTVHLPSDSVENRLDDVQRLLSHVEEDVPCLLAGDWNSVGQDPAYDPDPPDHRLDRRVAARLVSTGLTDAAHHLAATWQPTWGHSLDEWPAVRIDCFWVNRAITPAVVGYDVDTSVDNLSLHRPILLRIEPKRLRPVTAV